MEPEDIIPILFAVTFLGTMMAAFVYAFMYGGC